MSLLQIEGVNTKEDVSWYASLQGKTKSNDSTIRCILGSGVGHLQFRSNLPATSMGKKVPCPHVPQQHLRFSVGCSDVGDLDKMQWLYLKEHSALTRSVIKTLEILIGLDKENSICCRCLSAAHCLLVKSKMVLYA